MFFSFRNDDGGYYAKVARTNGKITSVVVEFIGDEPEETCVEPDDRDSCDVIDEN